MDDWLAAELWYSTGRMDRFAFDEDAAGALPASIQWDTQIPGGHGAGSLVLPRPPKLRADDAALFSHAVIYGAGKKTRYEGRVNGVPQVGANEIRLELEGWVAALEDDETFQMPFVDIDLSHWEGTGIQDRINHVGQWEMIDPTISRDSGKPALALIATGPWSSTGLPHPLARYRSPVPLGSIIGYWERSVNVNPADVWTLDMFLGDDDVDTAATYDSSGDLLSAGTPGPGTITLDATTATRKFGRVAFYHSAAVTGNDGEQFMVIWPSLGAYGNHGCPKQTGGDATRAPGLFAHDMLAYALDRSAPELTYTIGDSIERSTYVVRHFVVLEPTNIRQGVVEPLTALGGAQLYPNDWGVYGREFFHRSPGSYGKTWRVRKDQGVTPTSEGPDSKERIGGYMISYRDNSGGTHSVGPPGSGADYETTDLLDTDPNNPANRLKRRWQHRQAGILDREGALNVGRMLLAEANRVDWRGSTVIRGEATDDAGNKHPACAVQAGDQLVVEDEEGLWAPRAIESTRPYNHDDASVTVNIGAPPHRGEVMLAQLAAAAELVAA